MISESVIKSANEALVRWYESRRPESDVDPPQNVVCAGLAVLELVRGIYPLAHDDYITENNQIRGIGGSSIRKILARHGESRAYLREGGRTTRSTVPAAQSLFPAL
ncbi:MAG: DUF4928 family protein [Candidatus Marinimicrobia bacterium]|nr:DUF4928 family protein [Candidatus Neomarinimicrobiota bacterium]